MEDKVSNQKRDEPSKKPQTAKPQALNRDGYDPFVLEDVFPDLTSLLCLPPLVSEIAQNCVFLLDASALLALFGSSEKGLKEVAAIYKNLAKKKRLYVAARALREYAKHRTDRIRETYQQLVAMGSRAAPLPSLKMPPIESSTAYQELLKLREDANSKLAAYGKKLAEVTETVKAWNQSDDVSKLYAQVFPSDHILNHNLERTALLEDLEWRTVHNIPPGFQDSDKPDGGIGDLHIWHTIIQAGTALDQNIIFVSNDEKNDWMVRSNKTALFPRSELLAEFYVATKKHFAMMTLNEFLKLQGASAEVANEIKPVNPVAKFATPSERAQIRVWWSIAKLQEIIRLFIISNSLTIADSEQLATLRTNFLAAADQIAPYLEKDAMVDLVQMANLVEEIQAANDVISPQHDPLHGPKRRHLFMLASQFTKMAKKLESLRWESM